MNCISFIKDPYVFIELIIEAFFQQRALAILLIRDGFCSLGYMLIPFLVVIIYEILLIILIIWIIRNRNCHY